MTPLNELKAFECAINCTCQRFPTRIRHEIALPRAARAASRLAVTDLHWITGGSVWRSRSSQSRRAARPTECPEACG